MRDTRTPMKIRWYNKISVQSTGIILLAACTVFISSVYFMYSLNLQSLEPQFLQSESEAFTHVVEHVDEVVLDYALYLTDFSNSHIPKHFMTDVGSSSNSDAHPVANVLEEFENFKRRGGVWKRIDLIDTSGKIQASTETKRIGSNVSDTEHARTGQKFTTIGTTNVYDVSEYTGVGTALLIISEIQHWSSSGEGSSEIVGYINGYLAPETVFQVTESFTSSKGSVEKKPLVVVNREGTILFQTVTTLSDALQKELKKLTEKDTSTTKDDVDYEETESIIHTPTSHLVHAVSAGHEEYKGFGWLAVTEINTTPIRKAVKETSLAHLKVYIPTIVLATLIALGYITYTFIFPISKISKHFETNTIGTAGAKPLKIKGRGEISKLAEGYNAFIAQIEDRTKKLTKTLEEVQVLNSELESTKVATLNILEDLDEEKRKVEETVTLRTQELVTEKQKLMHITENMFVGVILISEDGEPVFVNRQGKKILGIGDDISNTFAQLYQKFPSPLVANLVETCLVGKSSIVKEIENEDGIFEIMGRCDSVHTNTDQEFFGKGIWIRDITEQKQLERSKSELVAVASHQLRTPLTVTRGNLEMLLDNSFGKVNKKQRELLSDSQESVIRLILMVNDMLDITKIEKGDKKLALESFNILEPIETTVSRFENYTDQYKYTIHITKPEKDIVVTGDKSLLIQVFQNLIDNALRYGKDDREITITCSTKNNKAVISIADNGIGIPSKEQAVIFQRFYRASNAVRSTSGGSGLGLFIVKSFIEQMNGTVLLSSAEGVGTTFTITLPLA